MESQLKVSICSRHLKILLISVYGIKKIAYTGLETGVHPFCQLKQCCFCSVNSERTCNCFARNRGINLAPLCQTTKLDCFGASFQRLYGQLIQAGTKRDKATLDDTTNRINSLLTKVKVY